MSSGSFPETGVVEDAAQPAHLAPEHAHRPMLDVEIVVLDIGKHGARQAELAFERSAGVRVEQLGIFLRDAVALGGDPGGGTVDLLAALHTDDVIPDVAERDIEVFDPVFVGRIEAVAGGEIEPGILCLLPGLEPFDGRSAVARPPPAPRRAVPVRSAVATSSCTASLASFFNSSSGRNRSTSTPCTILAIAWSGMSGNCPLRKPKKSR